jgi:RNA polymerase sigma factor (sigma-70 family)
VEASALRAPAGLTRLALPSALLRLRSDEQLVAAFRQGSEEAFRVIHDRYRARLFAYTRQMLGGSRSDAEDALQDVFLRAYNALRMDERPVVLKAWLYRVAHNRCIDHLRRPTPAASEVFEMSRTPTPDPLAEAERREDLRRLIADVQRLPEQQRSALLMREMEGLSYADLAAALDTSIPAVKSLLVRARIGLVEAAEARNTACVDIRNDLALSFGKGVRASAVARKHMRECQACSDYRRDLRAVRTGLSALAPPAHPLGLVAKLLGLSAGGGGAAAGGSAAAGGGAAIAGGGVVAGTTAKVAAVVCCAALSAGTVKEFRSHTAPVGGGADSTPARSAGAADGQAKTAAPVPAAVRPARAATPAASTAAAKTRAAQAAEAERRRKAAAVPLLPVADEEVISPHVTDEEPLTGPGTAGLDPASAPTGGALAPAEEPTAAPAAGTTAPPPSQTAAPPGDQASAGTTSPAQPTGTATGSPSGDATASTASSGAASSPESGSTAPQG